MKLFNLKLFKIDKYHDCKLSITFLDRQVKEYNIHKIIFASLFDFFEKLFDFEEKTIYSLELPFESQIFDLIYAKTYSHSSEFVKDLHYYENILYLLFYLQYKDMNKFLNKVIKYIEVNYCRFKEGPGRGTGSWDQNIFDLFMERLKKMDLMNHSIKMDFINRISYEHFFQNHYDEVNHRLTLTAHLYFDDCFPFEEIEIKGVKFSIYHTDRYELQQLGFWLNYEIVSPQETPLIGSGILNIYSGLNVYRHKLKSFTNFKNQYRFTFDTNGRCGYIKENINSIYEKEPIDNFITFYQIIIDFEH